MLQWAVPLTLTLTLTQITFPAGPLMWAAAATGKRQVSMKRGSKFRRMCPKECTKDGSVPRHKRYILRKTCSKFPSALSKLGTHHQIRPHTLKRFFAIREAQQKVGTGNPFSPPPSLINGRLQIVFANFLPRRRRQLLRRRRLRGTVGKRRV